MTSIEECLPDYNQLVIVWGGTHEGPALGKYRKSPDGRSKDFFEVQPFMQVDYWTINGITHWQSIEFEIERE